MTVVLFVVGLLALVCGAELLVRGASRLALTLGISPLVVGLTVVAFGTSSPELAVSVGAALSGASDIAIGNVVGSNIFNVMFILGVSAMVTPLVVHAQLIRQEVPVMIGASVLLLVLILDGRLGRVDSGLLATLLLAYTVFLVRQSRSETRATRQEYDREFVPLRGGTHRSAQVVLVVAGLVLLVLGSRWLVVAAGALARVLGASDLVVGLTVVAAGTSLPEVATSVVAAVRGERDIAVGNVVGSNTFNILGCLGLSGVASSAGLTVPPAVVHFDIWVMVGVAFACLPVFLSGAEIARWEGALFLGYYVAYVVYLVLASSKHAALPAYSQSMLGFVVPLTIVTLVVGLLRAGPRPPAGP